MNDYEKLERLLQEKHYEELSASDLSFVDELMTASEYTAQRELLQNIKQAIPPAPMPPPQLSANLRAAVQANRKANFGTLHYWAMAAALLGVFLLGRWSSIPDEVLLEPVTKTVVKTETLMDTVFVDRVEEKIILKYINREIIVHDTVYIQAFADKGLLPKIIETDKNTNIAVSIEKSQNAKMTNRLLEMVVEVY